jgi:hypothetical protein
VLAAGDELVLKRQRVGLATIPSHAMNANRPATHEVAGDHVSQRPFAIVCIAIR